MRSTDRVDQGDWIIAASVQRWDMHLFVAVRAYHASHDDPSRLLQRAGAPRDLIDWASDRGIDEAWEQCDRGDWLIWLATVESVPLITLVEAAAACAERAIETVPRGKKLLRAAIREARAWRSPERCHERAAACEARAEMPAEPSYRTPPPTRHQRAAWAAALACRAAESVLRTEARRGAERDREGRSRAAAIGAGDQIISRGRFDPLCFDPDDDESRFCVDAAASAVNAAVHALLPEQADDRMLEQCEGELSEIAFGILDPIRTGLRAGQPARQLVREIALATYRSDESSPAEPIVQPKRAAVAIAASLVIPIGGGHYYAEHRDTGIMLTMGIVGSFLASFVWSHLLMASLALVAADAIFAPAAVRRRNTDAILSPVQQLWLGFLLVLAALLIAWVVG